MSTETPSANPAVPDSRVYRHVQCGSETVISGQAFEVASNPLADMTRTWCNQCSAMFPVTEYEWSDTGEKISDYYARHSARASSLDRFLCSKKFMIICAVAGFVLGAVGAFIAFRGRNFGVQALMIPVIGFGGVFVCCAIYLQIGKPITKRVCGVSDTRTLK